MPGPNAMGSACVVGMALYEAHASECFPSRIEPAEYLRGSPHAVGSIEVAAHGDVQPRAGPAPRLLGDLKPHVLEDHRVVLTDRAMVFVAKDQVEVRRNPQRYEGRVGIRRSPSKARVVVG